MKTTLFLGAGASAFAKMPTTKDLIGEVRDRVDRETWESPDAKLLAENVVYAHNGKDVEDLYLAIRTLIDAETQHLAVVEYKTKADDGDGPWRKVQDISQTFDDNEGTTDETRGIDENIRALKALESSIRNTLLSSLMVKPGRLKSVASIYDELFKSVSRDVITTNYDNVLESYCEQSGLDLVNGFEKTHIGDRRTWNDAWKGGENALRLVKLHGSITWQKDDDDAVLEIGRPGLRDSDRDVMIAPTLGRKDYSNDIFPALMSRFKTMLSETELLVVVGCSFRDPEVNEILQKRLVRSDENPDPMKLLCLDPNPDVLKELVGKDVETREGSGPNGFWLKHFLSDRMPHVYSCESSFEQITVDKMELLLADAAVARDNI